MISIRPIDGTCAFARSRATAIFLPRVSTILHAPRHPARNNSCETQCVAEPFAPRIPFFENRIDPPVKEISNGDGDFKK